MDEVLFDVQLKALVIQGMILCGEIGLITAEQWMKLYMTILDGEHNID